jgi:hypothetical protein
MRSKAECAGAAASPFRAVRASTRVKRIADIAILAGILLMIGYVFMAVSGH